jgi:hypothetical protein
MQNKKLTSGCNTIINKGKLYFPITAAKEFTGKILIFNLGVASVFIHFTTISQLQRLF